MKLPTCALLISAMFSLTLPCEGASVDLSTDQSTVPHGSNKTLRVTSILEVPFLTRSGTGTGNDQYVGFMADLLKVLATKVGFSYEINLVKDNQYGRLLQVDDAGKCNSDVPPDFCDPRAKWIHATKTMDWYDRRTDPSGGRPCRRVAHSYSSSQVRRQFHDTVSNTMSAWLVYIPAEGADAVYTDRGSVGTQLACEGCLGSEYRQRKGLGILAKKPQSGVAPVATVEELSKQTKIEYGLITGGSTFHFFKDSQTEPYKTMYNFMVDHDHVFVHSIAEGVEKVRSSNGTYAFIGERPAAEYLVQALCDLMLIGEDFAPRDVAFATPIGSPLTDRISEAVSQLKTDGTVASLYKKWWKSGSGCH